MKSDSTQKHEEIGKNYNSMNAIKTLSLNFLSITKIKQRLLSQTYNSYFEIVSKILKIKKANPKLTRKDLHNSTYKIFKDKYKIASELIISARVYAWSIRKQNIPNKICVRFDKRLFSFKKTKRGNPILSLRLNSKRVGLPIKQDGAYRRFQEHINQGWEVSSVLMSSNFRFFFTLKKSFPEATPQPNILGVDINSGRIALSIINPRTKKVLRQLYLGKDIALRQVGYEIRRAKIQSKMDKGSNVARKSFRRISGKQRSYVRTRIWQIVSEIIKLAKEYKSNIAIEDIKNLRVRKREMQKKSRKIINRIPYGFFRFALIHKAMIEGIKVIKVNPSYTSQTCYRCKHVSRSNRRNYKQFKCVRCGFEVNADRLASINICLRAGGSNSQVSETGAAVNQPVRPDEVCWQHLNTDGKLLQKQE
jgi:IS605 OrfB family transposase